jgi:hypothetical protein
VPAEALGIRDAGERQLFGIVEMPLDFTIEETQLLQQRRMTARRRHADQRQQQQAPNRSGQAPFRSTINLRRFTASAPCGTAQNWAIEHDSARKETAGAGL